MKTIYKNHKYVITLALVWLISSCEDFVQVELPNSQISTQSVFEDDKTAMAAATGMYSSLLQSQSIVGGLGNPLVYLAGLSSDELTDRSGSLTAAEFNSNQLTVLNSVVLGVWSSLYNSIFRANLILEGIATSTSLSETVKKQVEGEAKFVRGFCYFYLVNLFGDVPKVVTTDYRVNATLSRAPDSEIIDLVISDLLSAKSLLAEHYYTTQRTRPNKWAATAMLARVYLYIMDYPNAEREATTVINATAQYELLTDLSKVFLANSTEAIWQLSQVYPYGYVTADGYIFGLVKAASVNPSLVSAFEIGDLRKSSWLIEDNALFYPYKYKTTIYTTDANYPEYLTVLRLAEQYLIRAEANAQQDDLDGAKNDINAIRGRAGLGDTKANDKTSLLDAVFQERRTELFCEFGHRWLDLKRTGMANAVLAPLKANWSIDDELYPVPASEITNNPRLNPQNPGY